MENNELMKRREELYAKAERQTIETLPAFMEEVLSMDHTYESIVTAIAMCAVAAAWAANNHPNYDSVLSLGKGGITGWQASFVMRVFVWEFVGHWMHKQGSAGMKLVDFDNMLYPQYDYKFNDHTISASTFEALQEKAKNRLETSKYASKKVRAHWESIVAGTVPFGWEIRKEDEE